MSAPPEHMWRGGLRILLAWHAAREGDGRCVECSKAWPCRTVFAAATALGPDDCMVDEAMFRRRPE